MTVHEEPSGCNFSPISRRFSCGTSSMPSSLGKTTEPKTHSTHVPPKHKRAGECASFTVIRGPGSCECTRQIGRTDRRCCADARATYRPQNWEAPGRAHSAHPARAPSGRSLVTSTKSRCGWEGKISSRRELRRHARLAHVVV